MGSLAPCSEGPRAGRINTQAQHGIAKCPAESCARCRGISEQGRPWLGAVSEPPPPEEVVLGLGLLGSWGASGRERGKVRHLRKPNTKCSLCTEFCKCGCGGSLEALSAPEGWRGAGERKDQNPAPAAGRETEGVDLVCVSFLSLPHKLPQGSGAPQQHGCAGSLFLGQTSCPAWPGSPPRVGVLLPRCPNVACSCETCHKLRWRRSTCH